ncbi:MAG: M42 family metallopeptidase [Sporocytophaga sp.]|uniref:M42 family metallopeptidase n=1 Tax=Sporocytophaga sp. TaxID=2231183 RepID=UPI001B197802|nr:M42 family metallopeptidase [Sporocytophaga sp.]MBO9700954.1 M42 family metallopeptidase [Sporocytophaga sp.]
MELNLELLTKICELPGAPGYEQKIRAFVIEQIKSLVDEFRVDNLGNVIALKKGLTGAKKVMAAAHMDEIGFIVTYINDQGFIFFHPLGGFDPKTLTAQRVIVHGSKDIIGVMGSKPVHVMSPEEKIKPAKIEDFFIDTGMTKEEVEKYVSIGNPITRERSLIEMGNNINCKSLDNRISVFILIEALKQIQNHPYDFYAVFTVQEEVGLRGATTAAHQINPDFGIAIDTTIAYDVPGAKPQEKITELGKGSAIKIMDSSAIADYRMVNYLKQTASNHSIQWQPEILTAGGTDTAPLQKSGKMGAIAGAISIPTRHIHQVIEMVNKDDVKHSINLLSRAIEGLDKFDWNF